MFIGKYMTVNELLHFFHVDSKTLEGVDGAIFPMPENAKEKVVRSYAVTACPHRFFSGVVHYRVEFV